MFGLCPGLSAGLLLECMSVSNSRRIGQSSQECADGHGPRTGGRCVGLLWDYQGALWNLNVRVQKDTLKHSKILSVLASITIFVKVGFDGVVCLYLPVLIVLWRCRFVVWSYEHAQILHDWYQDCQWGDLHILFSCLGRNHFWTINYWRGILAKCLILKAEVSW